MSHTIISNPPYLGQAPTLENGGLLYIYIFTQFSYSGKMCCKIGVSKNPKNRRFYSFCGPFEFYKQFGPYLRAKAFNVENLAKKHFKPRAIKSELFKVTSTELENFIIKACGHD